ncbi:MAG: Crp/Fnr family transcriptional regulator [Burkholderiaceae bacterium]
MTINTATAAADNQKSYPYMVVQGGWPAGKDTFVADPMQNRILAALPGAQLDRLLPQLECVKMTAGEVVDEYGRHAEYVYFPVTSIVSLRYDMEDGASAEVAIVGKEGMVGVGHFMAGETLPGLSIIQATGYGFRLPSRALREQFERSKALQHALLCYTQALIIEIAQNAVCNRLHSISRQLCRCLLLTLDRSATDEMVLTHEMIASSLGVRRECVTVAAGKLRKEGLIDYRRGHITVLDREGLEERSCECYRVVKRAFDHLLPEAGEGDVAEEHHAVTGTGHRHFHVPHRLMRAGHLRAMK